jgi:hypothetical protein
MANTSQVPDVRETDLERSDLEEAAQELGLDEIEELDDQELFERIGVALGEIDLDELEASTREEVEEAVDRADEAGDQAEDAAEQAAEEGEDAAEDAQDTAEDAADEAGDTAEQAAEEGEDAAEDAQDTAEDAAEEGEDAAEEAGDTAEQAAEDAQETAEDATDEASGQDGGTDVLDRDPEEYRFEDDPRDGIEPVLDLEVGPVALDLLGVEIHLRRVHAVLTANPNGKRNIIGKVLAQLSQAASMGGGEEDEGSDDEDTGSDDDTGEASGDDESDDGLLHTLTAPARGLANGAKKLLGKD